MKKFTLEEKPIYTIFAGAEHFKRKYRIMRVILASSSPRRHELLKIVNSSFDIIAPEVDESRFKDLTDPVKHCTFLAELKAQTVSRKYSDALVIGADTIVLLNGEIIGKPTDRAHAHEMLRKLSGKTHQVLTGVSLQQHENGICRTFYEKTDVNFRSLSDGEISYYIDEFAPYDKAGSYGIQDFSAIFVEGIRGCYFNVVGFPVSRYYRELEGLSGEFEFISGIIPGYVN